MKKFPSFLIAVMLLVGFGGCTEIRNIPSGFAGKILTPSGWQDRILTSGQIDIGDEQWGGRYNTLVLLEVTSTTVKEQFLQKTGTEDGEDHRVTTKDGTVLTADVYIRAIVPDDKTVRDDVYLQITPSNSKDDGRVKWISVETIYDRFARMDVRAKAREIFTQYEDYPDVIAHLDEINEKVNAVVLETFRQNGVPLTLQNAAVSNVKPDEKLWAAQNIKASADAQVEAINKIGAAMRQNPEYGAFLGWESLKEIAKNGSEKGVNTIIITPGGNGGDQWASAEYLRQQLGRAK